MGETLPNLCYYNNNEYQFSKPYSEDTARIIDEEVKNLIAKEYERAKKILSEHKEGHEKLAQLLVDREVIFADDVEAIFGKRPWASRSEEILASSNEQKANANASATAEENADLIRAKAVAAVIEKAKMSEQANAESKSEDNKEVQPEENASDKTSAVDTENEKPSETKESKE